MVSSPHFFPVFCQHHVCSLDLSSLLIIQDTIEKALSIDSVTNLQECSSIVYSETEKMFEKMKHCQQNSSENSDSFLSRGENISGQERTCLRIISALNLIRGFAELGMDEIEVKKFKHYFSISLNNTKKLLEIAK